MKFDFSNRVIIITGAAGNLGAATARAFQSAGARLALVDRSSDRLPNLFPDLADSPDHFFAPPTDVTDPASVGVAIEEINRRFGRIDALVALCMATGLAVALTTAPPTEAPKVILLSNGGSDEGVVHAGFSEEEGWW